MLWFRLRFLTLLSALLLKAQGALLPQQGFTFSGLSNRFLTPNGDGKNDTVVFSFDNPQFSEVSGKVFDMKGAQVANLAPGPAANTSLQWDGRSGSQAVRSGIYIFIIESEGRLYRGAVVVVR